MVWSIIWNKDDSNREYTRNTLVVLMAVALNLVAIALLIMGILIPVVLVDHMQSWVWKTAEDWITNMLPIVSIIPYGICAFLFALLMRACANEISREKDKNYIVALFSGITGFAALIISLVALCK